MIVQHAETNSGDLEVASSICPRYGVLIMSIDETVAVVRVVENIGHMVIGVELCELCCSCQKNL